ncbi:hypothetical protein KAMFAM_296 [Bacillus phage Kamfam]|nr:hypothetical protein KAMFAM_296 [Bacillus phage Kamfam]
MEAYINELKAFAIEVNLKTVKGMKYTYKRKITNIAKKYNKDFETVFMDWNNIRLGL